MRDHVVELASARTSLEQRAEASLAVQPDLVIKVDLDERAFLFPAAKPVVQLHVQVFKPHKVRLSCTYLFNEARHPPDLLELSTTEVQELARLMIEAVYRARSTQLVTATSSIGFTVVTNGYILQFGDHEKPAELFLSTGCIWRVCGALARAADLQSPIQSN
jgi:hypothetical protein